MGFSQYSSESTSTTTSRPPLDFSAATFDPTVVPDINAMKLPDWMATNPDQNMQELLESYKGIPKAFDASGSVKSRNDSIGYNTAAGTQAANNAASEYANRAAQTGGSSLGAGVVKAQAMMPVLAMNAGLKSEAADIASKSHQAAAGLASQVASTIGNLRISYLDSLSKFVQGQQSLGLQNQQFNRGMALDTTKTNNATAQAQATLQKQQSDQARLAAMGVLSTKAPAGQYQTNMMGQVTSGTKDAHRLGNWQQSQEDALSALRGMF